MRAFKYGIVLSVLFFSFTLSGFSQSFRADMEKVRLRFNGSDPFFAQLEVKYYKEMDTKVASVVKRGIVKKLGPDNYYSRFDGMEYLTNKKYTLFIDRGKKLIVIKDSERSKNKDEYLSVPRVDKERESEYTIKSTVQGSKIIYEVRSKKNSESGFSIELDEDGSRLLKITYYGGNSYARTVITYTYPDSQPLSPADFSEGRYVTRSQKTFVPVSSYAGYEINNQTR